MNCRDLHAYVEQNPAALTQSDGGSVGRHVSDCADCRNFVEDQRRLQQRLRIVRESVLPASESLDARVLAAYRRHMAERNRVEPAAILIPRSVPVWIWALAAAILGVGILYFSAHTIHRIVADQKNALPASMSAAAKTPSPAESPKSDMAATGSMRGKALLARPAGSSKGPSARHASLARTAPVQSRSSGQEEFRSLMYCDPLSCAGAMELIHVQLPSSLAASTSRMPGDFVNADVLVGTDGIARAIRIEE